MSKIHLEAQVRTDLGRGASRRLRRLENQVLGVIYGGHKDPVSIQIPQNKVIKALEHESIYSSVFDVTVNKKVEHVILKALQRHPYKPMIMHMDLQRVSAQDVLVKLVPLHFINEESAKGVKAGGIISHSMTQVEVRCQVKDLPEFIEVDMANVDMNDIVHLSHLKLPKNVHLTADFADGIHDTPVVSIHPPKIAEVEEEATEEVAADAVPTESSEKKEEAKGEHKDKEAE